MGPRASRWWIAYLLVFGAALLAAAAPALQALA